MARLGPRRLLPLLALALCARPAAAAPGRPDALASRYILDSWTTDEGLPQNTVNALLQTRDGYLWVGTYEGLARFDGIRFTVFNTSNTPALKSNGIRALCQDARGVLWVGTNGGGLVSYSDGRFAQYSAAQGLPNDMVWALAEAADGGLWVGTNGAGLAHFKDGRFRSVGAGTDTITSIQTDPDGGVLVGTGEGVKRMAADGSWATYASASGSTVATVVYRDREGIVWVGGVGSGLARLEGEHLQPAAAREAVFSGVVNTVAQAADGSLWLATNRGDLLRREGGRFAPLPSEQRLPPNAIYVLRHDLEGSLWIGTNGAGLWRLRRGKFVTYAASEGLPHDFVYPVHEAEDGAVWVGTGGGLARFDGERWTALTTRQGLCHDVVRSISGDGAGGLWVGTYGGGICRVQKGRVTSYTTRDGLAHDSVRAVLRDSRGVVWVATIRGLSRLEDGRFTNYGVGDGLPHRSLICLHEDRSGSLWIGTDGGGLTRLRDGRFETFTTRDGLASNVILALREEPDGTLWIGTNGGLTRLRAGRFDSFSVRSGLASDSIDQILEDDRGFLWLGTSRGVSRVSRQQLDDYARGLVPRLRVDTFGRSDGMKSSQCTAPAQPAGLRDRSGRLWFATSRGVAVLDPARIELDTQRPPVVVESLMADDRAYPVRDGVTLPPGTGRIRIEYTGLCLLTPERVRFKVRLEGFDADWVEVEDRRTAEYTNLSPGRYRFRVIAANGDGVWNEEGASLELRLRPRYYQSVWFFALLGLSLGAAVLGGYQLRVRRLRRRERELTVLVEERTRKLLEEKERAEDASREAQRQERLAAEANALKGEFLGVAAHDLRSPLQVIMGYAEMLARSAPSGEQVAEMGRAVHRSARRMLALIEDLLAMSALDAPEIDLRRQRIDLAALASDVLEDMRAQADRKQMALELRRGEAALVDGDPDRLRQALDNLVENAIKFSPPGRRVRVAVERRGASVRLDVTDEGPGLTPEDLPRLFGRFERLSARPTGGEHTTGLGLSIVKRLVELHGGRVFAESAGPEQGSTFSIELPAAPG